MSESTNIRPFEALAAGLEGFHQGTTGEPANKIAGIKGSSRDDIIPGIIEAVLSGIGDSLCWVYNELEDINDELELIDCGMAAFEVFGETMISLMEVLPYLLPQDMARSAGLDGFDLSGISQGMAGAEDILSRIGEVTNLVPSPEDIDKIFFTIEQLLGPEVKKPYQGTLGELFERLGWNT